jgi:hypothetical protein
MPRPEIAALDAYRLEHDWTFDQLAEAMDRAHCAIPARTLHYLLKRLPRDAKPLDRTIFKIKKFLKLMQQSEARRAARAAKPAAEVAV